VRRGNLFIKPDFLKSRYLTCKEEENERIKAKKSSGFGESGESGLSP
jgi:hypothetical protein